MKSYHLILRTVKLTALAMLGVAALVSAGCRTSEPASASFASVKISGKTPQEICQSAGTVFTEDGYKVLSLDPGGMIFQKEGTRGQSIAYGGVVDTHYGSTTAVRVRAAVVELGADTCRLQCKAYIVRDASESAFFQDETPLANIRSRPYQNLLDKVAKQLK